MDSKVKRIFAAIMILTGLLIFSYPFISQMLANRHATEVVQEYQAEVEEMDHEQMDAIKEAAKAYNEQLGAVEENNEAGMGVRQNSYIDMVDIGAALGYLTVPTIDLNLPIYEGTSDMVLAEGIGHLSETSYPIGGESTHAALSGHRGMAEKELFTNLDKVKVGDQFFLHILDEVLAYQVDQILVVLPDDISDLAIVQGEDLCTLVTCTPLGINSHRLLVRGHRVDYDGGEQEDKHTLYQSVHTGTVIRRMTQILPWMLLALMLMLGVEAFVMLTILRHIRQRQEDD